MQKWILTTIAVISVKVGIHPLFILVQWIPFDKIVTGMALLFYYVA